MKRSNQVLQTGMTTTFSSLIQIQIKEDKNLKKLLQLKVSRSCKLKKKKNAYLSTRILYRHRHTYRREMI